MPLLNLNKPLVALARIIHIVSSVWVFILALVILVDVFGRVLFSQPLEGTKEILQNSVIAVTFLQLPLAIYTGSMLKTMILGQVMSPLARRIVQSAAFILGAALFVTIAQASWVPAWDAVRIGEYEGEGALRIYTWPVRFLMIATSALAAIAYVAMLIATWTDNLTDGEGLRDA